MKSSIAEEGGRSKMIGHKPKAMAFRGEEVIETIDTYVSNCDHRYLYFSINYLSLLVL